MNVDAAPSYLSPRAALDWIRNARGADVMVIIALAEPPKELGYTLAQSGRSWWRRFPIDEIDDALKVLTKIGIKTVIVNRSEKPKFNRKRMLEFLGPLARHTKAAPQSLPKVRRSATTAPAPATRGADVSSKSRGDAPKLGKPGGVPHRKRKRRGAHPIPRMSSDPRTER